METLKSIENALSLVDAKKESLKKAFEELQSHSSMLASFNLNWDDLDSYLTSVQSELLSKFDTLKALESSSQMQKSGIGKQKESPSSESVPARPELKSMCEKMDGSGLCKYVMERPKERTVIRVELADAFKHAPDPGLLVLDAMEGFWDGQAVSSRTKAACVVLLEELMRAGVEIRSEVKERAAAAAKEWKGKMEAVQGGDGGDGGEEGREEGGLERLGYLHLLATYKLFDDVAYDVNVLIDYVVLGGRYRQTVDLCRILGLESKVSDIVQKLISKDKQLLALKFIFEFGLTNEFPPVPLLKDYVMYSKRIAQKIRKSGKNSRQSVNEAAMKEISSLKSVIKCIEDHNLESQYPKAELVTRVEKLEKEKADRKRPAAAPVPKPQQPVKQQQQNANKRMRAAAFKRKLPPAANSVVPQSQTYGMAGPLVTAAPQYVGPSSDLYRFSGGPMGFHGNMNPSAASNPYPPETHAQPLVYYDNRPMGSYGGYDVASQYHPAYYPQ
ncbi:hypothetical protein ABFS83_13G160000 [Erythranthe nasuta]